ncbi:hypothetical protein DFH06DRAFT_1469910 [Mycena polygramma]|nr:hypothetical protein DFH06DRAFT_1469910 [Mycena polygramma]
MASVIWIDSDDDDDGLIEIIENPTPRKPLAGPSKIANTSSLKRLDDRKKKRQREESPDCVIVETPRASKIRRAEEPTATVDDDDDHAVALALQKKWEEEDQLAQKRATETDDKSRRLIARLQKVDDNMAEKRRKLAEKKDVPDDGIVFQVAIDSEGNTVEGIDDPDNTAHLELVKRDFGQALAAGVKLKTVRWFVNAKLEARFEAAKETLTSLNIDSTEKNLFHGTADANVESILKNGFYIPGVTPGFRGAHGASCGVGVYLATSPATSLGYAQGASRMFMCRVITGRSTAKVCQKVPRPLGKNGFESWSGPGVYVVKYVELVVPRYVVEFEYNAALANYGGFPMGGLAGGLGAGPAFGGLPPAAPVFPPGMMFPGLFGGAGMALPPAAAAVFGGLFGAPAVGPVAPPALPALPAARGRRAAKAPLATVKVEGNGKMKAEDPDADWGQ